MSILKNVRIEKVPHSMWNVLTPPSPFNAENAGPPVAASSDARYTEQYFAILHVETRFGCAPDAFAAAAKNAERLLHLKIFGDLLHSLHLIEKATHEYDYHEVLRLVTELRDGLVS